MSEEAQKGNEANWNCLKCNSAERVPRGARFFKCDTCGSLFRFYWRGGQIEGQLTRQLLATYLESGRDVNALRSLGLNFRQELQEMNDVIRRLEMAKGGERLKVLAIFVIICAVIYGLFRLTVEGTAILVDPGVVELSVLAATVISMLVIAVFRLRKGAMVRKVNRLLTRRDETEMDLESIEAALALQFNAGLVADEDDEAALIAARGDAFSPDDDNQTDIIGKFASRKHSGRKRLNIRDDES